MGLDDFVNSALTCAQIIAAVFLFASSLRLREPMGPRLAAAAIVFVAWSALIAVVVPLSFTLSNPVLLGTIFALTLFISLGITLLVFEVSVWAALFCATAGYTMQNLASGLGSFVIRSLPGLDALPFRTFFTMVFPFVLVYALCYALLIRRIEKSGLELVQPQVMIAMITVVIFAVIAFDVVVKQIIDMDLPFVVQLACRLAHTLLCVFALVIEYELLYNRRLQHEVSAVTKIMENGKAQYRLSKETIEAINLKCHDIRHHIRQMGYGLATVDQRVIDEMAQEVNVYDSAVRTGNEPLDVILTEKNLVCNREGITLSCIANGACLDFMAPADLYALMGNALDNAIEAVLQLDERERRSISVIVRRKGGMTLIHVENYLVGAPEFRNGLPQTTKADTSSHGWGMKSMQLIAVRYHGTLHARVQGDVFHLNVMMPVPGE